MLLVFYAAQHKNLTENVADICVWPMVYMYVYRLQQQVDRNTTRVKLA